jgi:hypothetical protein
LVSPTISDEPKRPKRWMWKKGGEDRHNVARLQGNL